MMATIRTPKGNTQGNENPDNTQVDPNIIDIESNVEQNPIIPIPPPIPGLGIMPPFRPQATVVKNRVPNPNDTNNQPGLGSQRFQFPPPNFTEQQNQIPFRDFQMNQMMKAISDLAGTQQWMMNRFDNQIASLTATITQNQNVGRRLQYSSNNSVNSNTGAIKKTNSNNVEFQNQTLNLNAPVFTPRVQNLQTQNVTSDERNQNPTSSQFLFANTQVSQHRPNTHHGSQVETEEISSSPEVINPEIRPRRNNHPYSEKISDRVRVDKWGLSFDGRTGLSISEFIFRLETMQKLYKYPWSEILRDFTTFLSGDALKCYWKFIKNNSEMSWQKLKEALQHRFGSRKLDLDIWREMTDRKQGPKEKFVDFYDSILDLRGKLTKDLPDSEIIKLIKQNSARFIRNMVYPQAIGSIEELFEACLEVETTFSQYDEAKRQQVNQPIFKSTNKRLFAINDSGEVEEEIDISDSENIAAIDFQKRDQNPNLKRPNQNTNQQKQQSQHNTQPNTNQPSNFQCFNCKNFGHGFFNCPYPQKEIFCFRCGMANCTLPQCPNCNSGNGQSRVKERALSRSIQTQTSQPNNQIEKQNQ